MEIIISFIIFAMRIYIWVMIAGIAMSWLMAFNVLNARNKYVEMVFNILNRFIEPVLEPVRRFIPPIGGIDISPIVILIGFQIIESFLISLLYQ